MCLGMLSAACRGWRSAEEQESDGAGQGAMAEGNRQHAASSLQLGRRRWVIDDCTDGQDTAQLSTRQGPPAHPLCFALLPGRYLLQLRSAPLSRMHEAQLGTQYTLRSAGMTLISGWTTLSPVKKARRVYSTAPQRAVRGSSRKFRGTGCLETSLSEPSSTHDRY